MEISNSNPPVSQPPLNETGLIDERQKPNHDPTADLRISPVPVFVAAPVLAMTLYGLVETWLDARDLFPYVLYVLLAYLLSGLGMAAYRWKPAAARWFALAQAVGLVYLAVFWLNFPGAVTLSSLPPVLAIPLVGFAAGASLAGATLLFLLWMLYLPGADAGLIVLSIVQLLGLFGAAAGIFLPARTVVSWSWDYFQKARGLLDEARNRQGELSRAMGDLAHANQQLARLHNLAQGLRQAAEDARLAKEQFVTNVSHELRTPLNMIIGFSEMILSAPESYGYDIPSALLADLAIVRRNAEHLAELIDDVLDISQIEADQMALTREQVSIPDVIVSGTDAVRPLYNSKHLYLNVDFSGDIPPVYCDRTRIREVILNLLSNAGRFTEQGGVDVRAWVEHNRLLVSVSDTGPGMNKEQMGKLFQPFQQLDASIRRRYGGTGLGLNISKRFIELHDGKIWAESQPGIGTTFTFQLPIEPVETSPGQKFTRWMVPEWDLVHRVPDSAAHREPVRPRLVIYEQDNALERLVTRYLGDADIVPVDSMASALREINEIPSQLLLINHPDGQACLEQLDTARLPYEIPVIACSVPGSESLASHLGATQYLVKPIARKVLLETLERLGLSGGTVLVVDDEPEALRLFQRMLHAAGKEYHVLRARNGQEALRVSQQYRPDAILMDLVMPVMDGFQFLKLRREDPILKDIPIIITSARDSTGHPVVTRSLMVTRKGGISVHSLMECVRAVTQILAIPYQPAGQDLKAADRAGSVC